MQMHLCNIFLALWRNQDFLGNIQNNVRLLAAMQIMFIYQSVIRIMGPPNSLLPPALVA
jgi:hypothetical protein